MNSGRAPGVLKDEGTGTDGLVAPLTPPGPHAPNCYLAARMQSDQEARDSLLSSEGAGEPGRPGAPFTASLELEHATLHLLDSTGGPLGSGTLMELLQDLGYRGSEPTVGRFLRAIDRRGLTARVSNRGRGLTDAGHRRLQQLCDADAQLHYERELIRSMRIDTIEDIANVLVARRALERETVRLAAENATEHEIAGLEAAIEQQRRVLTAGGAAIDAHLAEADVHFHSLLAEAGHNPVLTAAVRLIRRDKHLAVLLNAMLRRTSHKWVVGHERIVDAVKRRAPDEAESAMLDHINSVLADVRRYRGQLPQREVTR